MALTSGYTWNNGDQITSTRLNAQFSGGSAGSLTQASLAAGYSMIVIGDNSPSSPSEGWAWFDTSPGASEGVLRYYDGARWVPVGRGFLGYNTSGSTIDAGALVKYTAPTTAGTGDARQEIAATTSQHDIPAGMALTQATNGNLTVVITRGRVLTLKTTGSITAGDPVVPSSTTGTATTGADANYSRFYGAGVCGVFTKTGSGSTNEATLFPAAQASGISFRTPTKLLDGVTPGADNTWSGSFASAQYLTWSVTPPNVIARIILFRVTNTAATADSSLIFAVRQKGSSLTATTGAPFMVGVYTTDNGSAADNLAFGGQLILPTDPAGDGTDRGEYLVKSETSFATAKVTVWEQAVIAGGRTLL